MLYSIIPPILVVLSLVGIILFLLKKAPQVSRLGTEEKFTAGSEIDLRESDFFGRSARKIKNVNWKAGEKVSLAVLEKILKIFREIFLKLGVFFSKGWVRIKNRRKSNAIEEIIEEQVKSADEAIIEKIKNYVPEKKIDVNPHTKDAHTSLSSKHLEYFGVGVKKEIFISTPAADEEKPMKPMVSEKAVQPKVKTEMKDRLEELLVERIAANPKDIEAYERLGQYYMEIESYEFAKECFKQIVKLNPLNRNAKYTLKKLERLLGS